MNAINSGIGRSQGYTSNHMTFISEPVSGADLVVGSGFTAESFRAKDIGEVMDPLVMVDHYVMTEPTFGTHPHAGMSAVSLLFEDSDGFFHNRDSLGNDFDLQAGDLYWLRAGSGAVHDESPRPNARIHGLQVFVNVPQTKRFESPDSLLVRSEDMPVINGADYRVKIALGESNGVRGAASPSTGLTILDGTIQSGGHFAHCSNAKRGIWIQSVKGSLDIVVATTMRHLVSGQAVAIKTDGMTEISIRNTSDEPGHFALFDGAQIGETYIQEGPFVMGSRKQIAEIKAAYEAGQLGNIPGNY
ncbi:MAG: pirin family protein [Gammaproteobacteria bacterium]